MMTNSIQQGIEVSHEAVVTMRSMWVTPNLDVLEILRTQSGLDHGVESNTGFWTQGS